MRTDIILTILQIFLLALAVVAGIQGEYTKALFNMSWAILIELRFIEKSTNAPTI